MRPRRAQRGRDHRIRATTVLIVSASMGAGHDGAARELQRRLELRGDTVALIDFLDLLPLRFGRALRASYRLQLRFAPWSYELAYRLMATPVRVLWSPVVALVSALARGRLGAFLRRTQPDVVADAATATLSSARLEVLRAAGVDIANGGAPGRYLFRWERGEADCRDAAETLARTTGAPPTEFVSAHPVDAFDQMYCRTGRMKQRLIRANHTFTPTSVPTLRNHGVYVLDARLASPTAAARALHGVTVRARHSGLRVRSYRALR